MVRDVLRRGLLLAVGGLALGLAGTFASVRLLQTLLFEVSTTDPAILIGVSVLVASATVAASWFPARRATRYQA